MMMMVMKTKGKFEEEKTNNGQQNGTSHRDNERFRKWHRKWH